MQMDYQSAQAHLVPHALQAEGALNNEVNAHNDIISCVAFNSGDESGTQIFSGSYDKTVKSWDPAVCPCGLGGWYG